MRKTPLPSLIWSEHPAMVDALTQRLSSMALSESDLVVVVGLEKSRSYNFRPALVLGPPVDGRVPVRLVHGNRKQLSCRRHNLLRATHAEDRERLLTLVVWERQLELRVARSFLLEKLGGEEGLALHVASFFAPRQTMALTTGFANGKIIADWSCVTLGPNGRLQWKPVHGAGASVHGAQDVTDGIVRIDCAVVALAAGRFVVAGGCSDHPSRARKFFKSAFIYDALTHVASRLPDMPCARHGCGGAALGGAVYIVGGGYASADGTLVSRLDVASRTCAPGQQLEPNRASPRSRPSRFGPR